VYLSDITPDMKDSVRQIPIPDEYNPVARYPIAVLDNAQDPEIAQGFLDFILSREGQAILKKWGFGAKP
jgi:molybdate transport system substrate-binding protein